MRRPIEFLLVPDSRAGRKVRRELANRRAWTGVLVGQWEGLLKRAMTGYAIPELPDRPDGLAAALGALEDAFWSKSLATSPQETTAAVARAFRELIMSTDPATGLAGVNPAAIGGRLRRRLADFRRLESAYPTAVPAELRAVQELLRSDRDPTIPLCVRRCPGLPRLTNWQRCLVERLNADSRAGTRELGRTLQDVLDSCLDPSPAAAPGTALQALQESLFEKHAPAVPADGSVQWVGLRDHWEEAEIAAGMVQELLAAEPSLSPSQIGLLVPDSFEYSVAIGDAFGLAGLPLSGLSAERWKRDLGREAVYNFLHCRQKPAPAMALAVCFSSRLMPWPRQVGDQLAQKVMDGDLSPRLPDSLDPSAVAMRELLLAGDDDPRSLSAALAEFSRLLNGGEAMAMHVGRASEAVGSLRRQLSGARSIDWFEICKLVKPELITDGPGPTFSLEGVAVWSEPHEAWRTVRHLIVLGFCEEHYPARASRQAVMLSQELTDLENRLGLSLQHRAERQRMARLRFRRQLRSVTGSVTFLVPHANLAGEQVRISESFAFMQRTVAGGSRGLLAMLDADTDRARIRNLAVTTAKPEGPRRFTPSDSRLQLGRDLLTLGSAGPRPQSPSSLEILMLTPLGWLLQALRAEPREWRPDSVSPLIVGGIAHAVFESVFSPGKPLPRTDEVESCVRAAFDTVAAQKAPFLSSPHWHVERRNMATFVTKAASFWKSALDTLEAEVIGVEVWLEGTWLDVPVRGKADLLLELGDSSILIVDYKASTSKKRHAVMKRGYESQTTLYRKMAESGWIRKLLKSRRQHLRPEHSGKRTLRIAYFMMRDQTCLSDSAAYGNVENWREVEEDPSGRALGLIRRNLRKARRGVIELNAPGDRKILEKSTGLPTYAFDISPLIELLAVEP